MSLFEDLESESVGFESDHSGSVYEGSPGLTYGDSSDDDDDEFEAAGLNRITWDQFLGFAATAPPNTKKKQVVKKKRRRVELEMLCPPTTTETKKENVLNDINDNNIKKKRRKNLDESLSSLQSPPTKKRATLELLKSTEEKENVEIRDVNRRQPEVASLAINRVVKPSERSKIEPKTAAKKKGSSKPHEVEGTCTKRKKLQAKKAVLQPSQAQPGGSKKNLSYPKRAKAVASQSEIWDKGYGELKTYAASHGNCLVPQRYKQNPFLGKWVARQRRAYKSGKLSKDRESKLLQLGFAWNVYNKKQKARTNNVNNKEAPISTTSGEEKEPVSRENNPRLEVLVARENDPGSKTEHQAQTVQANQKNLTPSKMVTSLSVAAEKKPLEVLQTRPIPPHEQAWNQRYNELRVYRNTNGNCQVTAESNLMLATWVRMQRYLYKMKLLETDREMKLGQLGFVWE